LSPSLSLSKVGEISSSIAKRVVYLKRYLWSVENGTKIGIRVVE
jgi:hypothetical protein